MVPQFLPRATQNTGLQNAEYEFEAPGRLSAAAVWNGIFIVGATTWGMSFAQRSFRASTAAVAYAMEPLFAAIFAAGMLHESLTPLTIAGGVLIIAANVLVGLRAHSR